MEGPERARTRTRIHTRLCPTSRESFTWPCGLYQPGGTYTTEWKPTLYFIP